MFKYAYKLSQEHKIPYFLDYRDAWYSGERHKFNKSILSKLIRKYQFNFEKRYLKYGLGFITVSETLLSDIEKDFPFKKGLLVKNGVDLDIISSINPIENPKNHFIISYTGTIYNGHNVPVFLQAVKKIIEREGDLIKVKFIGIQLRPSKHSDLIKSFALTYPNNIEILPSMSQNEVFSWMKASNVLLKFSMRTTSKIAQSVKMYEYFAFKKPIIHILSENAEENDLLRNKNVQFFSKTEMDVESNLNDILKIWKEKNEFNTMVVDEDLLEFSRKGIARKFRENLFQIMNK